LSHVPDRLQDSWLCIATRLSDSLPWSARKQHHVPLADSAVALSAIPVSLIGISLDYSSIVAGASLIVLGICSKTPVNRPTLSVTTGGLRPLDSEKTSLDLVT